MTGDNMDDPELDGAVAKILARGASALGDGPEREDRRENRDDREPHEMQNGGEIDDRAEREGEPEEGTGEEPSGEGEEQFLEIPRGEGEEPERVPVTEAMQAVQQLRQLNGDIASAVIKAETEAQVKQDTLTQGILTKYQEVEQKAEAALRLMYAYLPQPPDPALRNTDPQTYYYQLAGYDEYVGHMRQVEGTIKQAKDAQAASTKEADDRFAQKENERLARYIPEWGKEETRTAKRAEIESFMESKYGVGKEFLGDVVDHRAWRMLNDLMKLSSVQQKAPEVRKAVQEKAPKIVNGRAPQTRDTQSGRYVSEARKELRETGSEDAFVRMLLRSGAKL